MSHAWATSNLLSALTSAAFTWGSGGPADATRTYLIDGRMDVQYVCNSVASTVNVVIDMGAATAISAFAVLNSNVRSATLPKLLIEGADNSGMSTNLVTAKALTTLNISDSSGPTARDHILQFASVTKRYWRLTWSWTGTFQLKIGEIFAANPTSLSRVSVWGNSERLLLRTVKTESMYGETRSLLFGGPIREKRMRWEDLTQAQMLELRAMWNAAHGPVTPVLWAESYEATATAAAATEQDVLYGRLVGETFEATNNDFGLYTPSDITIRSMGREVGS